MKYIVRTGRATNNGKAMANIFEMCYIGGIAERAGVVNTILSQIKLVIQIINAYLVAESGLYGTLINCVTQPSTQ
ncbi:hypothetical protein [Methanococcoides burtonii]|uniref:hypothetical protein n=1 Tax=Methanococcoides burtonii TaxID=29291 RepID=UPI000045E022|nr:hypothetical protein [Methanococcoides burtonii]